MTRLLEGKPNAPFARGAVMFVLTLSVTVVLALASPGIPHASAAASPALAVQQRSLPAVLPPGVVSESPSSRGFNSNVALQVRIFNRGGTAQGAFTVIDTVGPGLEVSQNLASEWLPDGQPGEPGEDTCTVTTNTVTCNVTTATESGRYIELAIPVNVTATGPTEVLNEVQILEGATTIASSQSEMTIGTQPPPFGFLKGPEGLFAEAFDDAGEPSAAGSHPYSMIVGAQLPQISLPYTTRPLTIQPLRSLRFEMPPGLVVNPLGVQVRCAPSRLEGESGNCPAGSQVGILRYTIGGGVGVTNHGDAIFNLIPQRGVPAELGVNLFGTNVRIRGGLSGDFRLTASSVDILSKLDVPSVEAELWGIASDHGHDFNRAGEGCEDEGGRSIVPCSIPQSPQPILTMPSTCGPLPLSATVTGWLGGEDSRVVNFVDRVGQPSQIAGCQNLSFSPSMTVRPTSARVSSPTGIEVQIDLPQNRTPEGTATATLKKVTVRFPEGVVVNPPAADGLGACSPSQIAIGDEKANSCPASSKVGTAEISTPLLEAPLKGSIYLAEQRNNPFGTLVALYAAVEGEGVVVKLPGRVDIDPRTGALSATFDNNPQVPFETLSVRFNEGPRAALATPSQCGTYNIRSELTSWASPTPVVFDSPFKIDQGCANGGFSPKLEAGTINPIAGAYSPFTLRITRQDGEQNLSRISATLPKGLLAKIAGVTLCPDVQAASGDCPAASQIGTTTTAVGSGSQPLFIPQSGKSPTAVYLSGSYKDAPYSLVVKVPAQAGPFDLGTIAVRIAVNVDPFTSQVTATSDPLPQILEGIPVAYRDVRVDTTRPEFILNPTSCEPMQFTSSLASIAGATASPSSRFQVAGCSSLGFKPTLKLSLTGPTKRTGHPALKAVVTYPKQGAYANISRAQVNLPSSEFLDQGNLNKTCTKPVLLAGNCPKATIYGKAKAWTPLLERPLEGYVYLVGGFGYKLPALVAELNGQIRVLLQGKVDTGPNKGIRNTFEAVPDAPVSRFVLEMKGGKKYGLLENSESLCQKPQHAIVRLNAQNGAVEQTKPEIAVKCGKAKKASGKKK